MAGKFVLKTAKTGKVHFNLKASNGQIVLTSEKYESRASAVKGIESVKKNSPLDDQYERKMSTSAQPYFVLKAKNHEVIGRSETYSSDGAMEKGIESVKKNGPVATVNDIG